MDLTSLTFLMVLLASAIGVDTAMHPASILLDARVTGKIENLTIDSSTLDAMLVFEVTRICATPSVLAVPEVRAVDNQGIGMAVAKAANMQSVAVALQTQLGYQPERIKITLIGEDGAAKLLVNGAGPGGRIDTPPFQVQLLLQKGETIASLVHRAALVGMSYLDPYVTSLYLVEAHAADQDFSEAEALIDKTKAALPPTVTSFDRSLLENLEGIIELARGKIDKAGVWFDRAITSDPDDAAARLNAGFIDMQLGQYDRAAKRVEPLVTARQPADKRLLSTAYMVRGAAYLAVGDTKGADENLAKAVQIDPVNASAYGLWSEVRRLDGNIAAADALHKKALNSAGNVANYAEVAALYFQLAWKPGQPLARNPFGNPEIIRFN
jgi:Tfp pilus assembly protein PilF